MWERACVKGLRADGGRVRDKSREEGRERRSPRVAVSQEVATVVPLLSVAWVGTLVAVVVEMVRGGMLMRLVERMRQ